MTTPLRVRAGVVALTLITHAASLRAQAPTGADAPRSRVYAAAVRSDLRNLVTAQERYFVDHVRYTTALDSLQFAPSPDVTITIERAGGRGWSATGRHARAGFTCWIFVGDAPRPRPAAREGEPACDGVPAAPAFGGDSLQMMQAMGPMVGNMMATMYEQMMAILARPETAERLASFTRNYFEALMRQGFTRDEAMRLTAAVGMPALR